MLSDEDRAALKRSAQDLSDICPCQLARIERDFADAYKRAEDIRSGKLDPLR